MKRLFNLILALAVCFAGAATANAQSKALKKDIKKTVKQKNKEGWKMVASTTTLEYALTKYRTYVEADEENRIVITGIAEGKNPKIGTDNAVMHGITNYAARASAQVKGKIKSLITANNIDMNVEEVDRFAEAYEAAIAIKVRGLIKQHFTLVRTTENGNKEFNVFMTLDEAKAKQAREEALAEAKRKADLQDLSEQVQEFIGEPVSGDEE